MNPHVTELPPTAWAVLAVLSYPGERSGYQIKRWADHSLRYFYVSPALSQIYRELKRLEALGYVEGSPVGQRNLPDKRLYHITEAGRAALMDWGRQPDGEVPVLKHGVLLRVWMAHVLTPEDLRVVVQYHRDQVDGLAREIALREQSAARTPGWQPSLLALRWSRRYYEMERDLAQQLLADIDEIAGASTPSIPAPTG